MGSQVSAEALNTKLPEMKGNPPPECPMHNKDAKEKNELKTKPSECPVQHDNNINPYNMVCHLFYIVVDLLL